ncbi:MAG: succinylglutamate-semialdehyde dehydrogenase [Hirschia sp.]|nr:succinylglutamate-semialdehyde dehydrogenase [Hirschia sp.]MBF19297.1 succinylglutamate-semialdehyde dehydrogenase [Hirschia sp.]
MAHPELTGAHYIDGEWTSEEYRHFGSANPVTGDILWSGHEASQDELNAAVASARRAFVSWSRTSLDERMEVIQRYSALAAERKEDLARLISAETGKALWDARTEAGAVAGKAAVSLEAYHERTPTRSTAMGAATMRITHRPHGVMAVQGPFNFPAHLPNGHIVPALIAGDTVVFKPSEQTPAVAEFMMQMWHEARLPAGVINMIQGARTPAEDLVRHADIDGVLFTGGVTAGLAIHRALAGHPEKILALELGGNNPLVVWDAADASSVARIAIKSAFITAGQRCTCARRLIVPEGPEGMRITSRLAAMMEGVKVGIPDGDPQPFIGSLVSQSAASDVLAAQEKLIANGAVAIKASENTDDGPSFLRPGLLDVTDMTKRADEEIFGPILQVIRVADFDAALAEANNTRFGLSAGLVSDDASLWDRFATDIRAGIVNWNRHTTGASGSAPFGGPGLSGNHRPAGYYAADYCAWPMASLINAGEAKDEEILPGMPE